MRHGPRNARQAADCQLLLTDVVMPEGISGNDLARRLRALKPELKVILTTGYSLELVVEGPALEPDFMLLQKPYRPAELVKIVYECLHPERVTR